MSSLKLAAFLAIGAAVLFAPAPLHAQEAEGEGEGPPKRYPPSSVRPKLIIGGLAVTGLGYGAAFLSASLAPELQSKRYSHLNYAYMWDRKFDYVIYLHFGAGGNPAPDRLRPVRQGTFFTLFRTPKPFGKAACAK